MLPPKMEGGSEGSQSEEAIETWADDQGDEGGCPAVVVPRYRQRD
jgi:hypothetical protein